jgi:hypothetical protein
MDAAIAGGAEGVDGLEDLVETALLFVPAFDGDGFNRVVGLDKTAGRLLEALPDKIGMNRGVDEFGKAELELLAVDGKPATKGSDAVSFVKVLIEEVLDLADQEGVSSFHNRISLTGSVYRIDLTGSV